MLKLEKLPFNIAEKNKKIDLSQFNLYSTNVEGEVPKGSTVFSFKSDRKGTEIFYGTNKKVVK
jgi:hypothetical protein